jgi:hypothetical protein
MARLPAAIRDPQSSHPDDAVLEGQSQPVVAEYFDIDDVYELFHEGNATAADRSPRAVLGGRARSQLAMSSSRCG